MPRGQYVRVPKPKHEDVSRETIEQLAARIADLERRIEAANEYFRRGYVPPSV
jgi:hypothetical protein